MYTRASIERDVSRGSRRGKHTRNPGWISGDHWVVCDICGCDIRNSDARQTWEGYVVCPDDWEPRHPQDFVRSVHEDTSAKGFRRSPQPDRFVNVFCTTNIAVAGLAVAGCAVTGNETNTLDDVPTTGIPSPL